MNLGELLALFLNAHSGVQMGAILKRLGDFDKEVLLNEKFGDGFVWLPVGARTTNVSTIELATHPGRSLVERINNAIDALVEALVQQHKSAKTPGSPVEAAQMHFGRPIDPVKLAEWFDESAAARDGARHLSVVVQDGAERDLPRVDVIDSGVGVPPEKFEQTIVGLNVEGKIKIPYALGLFGQGGASSFAFAEYTVIVSRAAEASDRVAFTVVRRCELRGWKETCYAYLAVCGEDGQCTVPSYSIGKTAELEIYEPPGPASINAKIPRLRHGTVVRHIDYKLPQMANSLSSSQKNLYHSLQYLLMDPLIPYRLTDLRSGQVDSRHMSGSRNRLMKLVLKSKEKNGDRRMELKHHHAMEFVAPPGSNDPCIGVEYWCVFSWRKEPDGSYGLRPGTEQFADRDHPLVFTYNGQNHGEMTAEPLRKIGLTLLSRHMVIQIDASRANGATKRELFTSTRENLKKSTVLSGIIERIQELLSDDDRLYELEKELTDRALSIATKTASADVKKHVIQMLKENGLEVSKRMGIGPIRGTGPGGRRTSGGSRQKLPPLSTLPFPSVSRFDIVQPVDDTNARIGESKSVLVETDADELFDMRGLIHIKCEPELMEVTHKSPLRGGRMSWRFAPASTARPGDTGTITATLAIPSESGPREAFRQQIKFEIKPPLPGENHGPVVVPDLEILPISPAEQGMRETWRTLWPDVNPDDLADAATVACKLFNGSTMVVYYNTEFPPYKTFIERWKAAHAEKCKAFDDAYKTYVAFHAVMQSQATRTVAVEPEVLDKILEQERALTATIIARHAAILATIRAKPTDDASAV